MTEFRYFPCNLPQTHNPPERSGFSDTSNWDIFPVSLSPTCFGALLIQVTKKIFVFPCVFTRVDNHLCRFKCLQLSGEIGLINDQSSHNAVWHRARPSLSLSHIMCCSISPFTSTTSCVLSQKKKKKKTMYCLLLEFVSNFPASQ